MRDKEVNISIVISVQIHFVIPIDSEGNKALCLYVF